MRLNPVDKVGDLGVDSRVVKTSTSNAPAEQTSIRMFPDKSYFYLPNNITISFKSPDDASKIARSISIVADHGATTVTLI